MLIHFNINLPGRGRRRRYNIYPSNTYYAYKSHISSSPNWLKWQLMNCTHTHLTINSLVTRHSNSLIHYTHNAQTIPSSSSYHCYILIYLILCVFVYYLRPRCVVLFVTQISVSSVK